MKDILCTYTRAKGLFMNSWAVVDWTADVWHFIVRVLAVVCGFVIGLERKSRSKEAGIRTHAIVCLAACLFMILSKYLAQPLFSDLKEGSIAADATRIASQVVTGIGFLGAGIIMYRRDVMHGLTTAAGVWATRQSAWLSAQDLWSRACAQRQSLLCCSLSSTFPSKHSPHVTSR